MLMARSVARPRSLHRREEPRARPTRAPRYRRGSRRRAVESAKLEPVKSEKAEPAKAESAPGAAPLDRVNGENAVPGISTYPLMIDA